MISGGFSLEVFKRWAPDELNLVTLPGYCVAGTIGHKLMSGKATKIDLDENTQIDVRCQIHQLSFSPHTDAKGIMDLVKFLSPKHVILVHGEKPKMATLKARIQSELDIQCFDPANNTTVSVPSTHYIKADASAAFIRSCSTPNFKFLLRPGGSTDRRPMPPLLVSEERVAEGILIVRKNQTAKVVHQDELLEMVGGKKREIQFAYCCPVHFSSSGERTKTSDIEPSKGSVSDNCLWIRLLYAKLSNELTEENIRDCGEHLQVESLCVSVCLKESCSYRISDVSGHLDETVHFCCCWSLPDENLAWKVISILKNLDLSDAQWNLLSHKLRAFS